MKNLRLRFLAQVNPPPSARIPTGGEIAFIPMEAIGENGGIAINQTKTLEDLGGAFTYFENGDVIVAKITPCFENCKGALVDGLPRGFGFGTTELHVLRSGPALNPKYLFYITLSDQFRRLGAGAMSGAAGQKRVPADFIEDYDVTVPSRERQRTVVDFLDRETAKVDDLIAKKALLIERLREIRRSTISRLATMGTCHTVTTRDSGIPCIGQIPDHWQLLRNKNLLSEIDDRSCDGTEELLTVSHITGVSPRRENQQVTMFMAESNEGYKRCLPDDIVINTMWAWMGALGVSIYAGLVSPAYNVYRFKQKAIPWYFHHLFRSPQYVAEIGRYSRGVWTSRLRLYPEEFLSMTSPVPPLEEQFKIAFLIDEQNKAASKESEMVSSAISLLREYRSALISAAVTGQLDLRQHEAQLEALA